MRSFSADCRRPPVTSSAWRPSTLPDPRRKSTTSGRMAFRTIIPATEVAGSRWVWLRFSPILAWRFPSPLPSSPFFWRPSLYFSGEFRNIFLFSILLKLRCYPKIALKLHQNGSEIALKLLRICSENNPGMLFKNELIWWIQKIGGGPVKLPYYPEIALKLLWTCSRTALKVPFEIVLKLLSSPYGGALKWLWNCSKIAPELL